MEKDVTLSLEEVTQELLEVTTSLSFKLNLKTLQVAELLLANKMLTIEIQDKANRIAELLKVNQDHAKELTHKKHQNKSYRTALRNIEKARLNLEKYHEYTKSVLDSNLDSFAMVGLDGLIKDVNLAMLRSLGLSRSKTLGTNFNTHFLPPEKADQLIYKAKKDKEIHNYELNIKHKTGKETPVLVNASLYKNNEGEDVGVFTASRDPKTKIKT
ncbi:MAG: signal transduction histidine kinase [Erysipelotrichaceae bacterium]|nr:MAG: signal transduction histidine [Erysipelotrichaceae bacterium]TXT17167.1 MAG: signal transduction histidine kinase [Erysipelotrichaceae bacterium]